MKEKTVIVEVLGTRYQLRRLSPDVGSYILMQIIRAGIQGANADAPADMPSRNVEEPKPEDLVRAMAFAAFGRLDFEAHRFIQTKCLSACSRMETREGNELPMPIVNDVGAWAIPEIRDDMALVMNLEMEVLVFNLSVFFAGGGLSSLAGSPASKA